MNREEISVHVRNRICLRALLVAAIFMALTAAPAAAYRFGTGCQSDYQNDWQTRLAYVWARCEGFNNRLDDSDTKVFYYDLHNAKWWWENAGDQTTLDNVDLFYANTHGGAWSNPDWSSWPMWDQNQRADSRQMRLGDEATGLSIFATYVCLTLKYNDGKLWNRMGPIFRGGLRYAAGSHDLVWDGYTTDHNGADFAADLQGGKSLKYAWKDSNGDWYLDQDIMVMATGASPSDCEGRRNYMTWQNFNLLPRLKDGQITHYCYSSWDNL
jgi:Family of unknown function (DUF6345)